MFWDDDLFLSPAGATPNINPNYGSGINWGSVINQGFGLASQIIGAWGRNPTQQIGYGGVTGIGQGYSPAAINQSQAQIQAAIAQQQQAALLANRTGGVGGSGVAEDFLGSLTSFVSRNPVPVFGGIFALYLLMREPPRRR